MPKGYPIIPRTKESYRRKTTKPRRQAIIPIGPSIAYLPLSGDNYACIEVDDIENIQKENWSSVWYPTTNGFYAARTVDGKVQLLHRLLMNNPSGKRVDHKNRQTLDCRRHNLRSGNAVDNRANSIGNRNSVTGIKGVTFDKNRNCYQSAVSCRGVRYVKRFADIEQARLFYKEKAIELFGEFARWD